MWLLHAILAIAIALEIQVSAGNGLNHQRTLSDAPPLRLHVTFKRKSVHLHGYSEFDVFASPVVSSNGTTVMYDSYATFIDGNTSFTCSFINGAGYLSVEIDGVQRVECLPSSSFLLESILPILNEAAIISSASVDNEAIKCPAGNLLKTTLAGVHFIICAAGERGFTVYDTDMMIEVKYLANPFEIQKPSDTLLCGSDTTPMSVTPTTLALLTGNKIPVSNKRQLKPAEHMFLDGPSCKCKSTPRPCVFFHGIGNPNEMEELQDTPDNTNKRMGNMNDHAPCCTDVKYAVLNTVDFSWTDDSLQQKFCDRALRLSDTSDVKAGVIKDTVIVTHSMGGLVMSMALATGKCSFGEGASWVAISTPMTGSMAADYLQGCCNGENNFIMNNLMEWLGKCPVSASRLDMMYENEKYASDELNAAYVLAQEAYRGNVSAAMCSNDYDGVFSVMYEAKFILMGSIILPHKSPENDGLVEFQSCAKGLDESLFGTSYKDKFYKPRLNHADTAFLTGDGLFKDAQKPMKWFECLL
ncbi:hypothetical protein PHMEG_00014723 [Phytophthora megakarya]|uniref:GPI inositol-deacylase n=1 Tax=Phytophthora megakarya TaxID=4795 RepID=A0A225W550_9STRA|nr:hypothetical protein PHMEG_00014723 [Phytophthora megakarya]